MVVASAKLKGQCGRKTFDAFLVFKLLRPSMERPQALRSLYLSNFFFLIMTISISLQQYQALFVLEKVCVTSHFISSRTDEIVIGNVTNNLKCQCNQSSKAKQTQPEVGSNNMHGTDLEILKPFEIHRFTAHLLSLLPGKVYSKKVLYGQALPRAQAHSFTERLFL